LQKKVEEAHPAPEVLRKVYQSLANYYQLAVGSGAFSNFDFDLEAFTKTYKLKALEVHHALHRLEQEGFLQLNEAFYTPSMLHIAVDHPTLYEYQVKYPEQDVLIKMLLRIYGGELYSNFMKISEKTLAKNLMTTPEAVKKALQYLHKLGLVEYEPQHDQPQLVFTTSRYDAASLPLDVRKLEQFRKQALEKVKAVQEYVNNANRCRTQMLVAYFGESYNKPCRICDYCLEQRKKQKQEEELKTKKAKVLELLQENHLHPKELLRRFSATDAPLLTQLLQELLENGVIRYNTQGGLELV
ncbi:MAG: RecQ family zinc-binding domain-containing protein, partial [Hymenobacteraceae bacterium]|nr:RecQ family zinc-binding domain-containing protein [Hymenobacteraceae bacterium]